MPKKENTKRATRAAKTVKAHTVLTGGGDGLQTDMVDLIADLMHLAARKNLDFDDDVLRIARDHFQAEERGE